MKHKLTDLCYNIKAKEQHLNIYDITTSYFVKLIKFQIISITQKQVVNMLIKLFLNIQNWKANLYLFLGIDLPCVPN